MAAAEGSRQLPLALEHVAATTRDDLVVTGANRAAVALVDRWPDWPSPVVTLAGPPGSGKSHLAAIWRERSGALRLDPADLAAPAGPPARPILIDAIGEEPFDEAALFHLVNSVRAAGSHILMTSRRFPAAWGVRLPDLASRLRAATTVEIGEPDEELLAGVVAKLFADRQVDVEPHVIAYLVRRIERSLSAAIGVVERLDTTAMERKTRITRALAAEAVGALDRAEGET